jgi:hypothetical protein
MSSSHRARSFSGVKVFSATMFKARDQLGETVTDWINARPEIDVVDMVVSQSSDAAFHCISICLFYEEQST